jgi:ribosome-binding ATPase YchF (GTP1/OBG family)
VKDTDVTNPYLDRVRSEVVDPALQIKTIEDELCAAIGKALGRQGEKVQIAIREMNEARARYLERIHAQDDEEALKLAHHHNDARKRAIKAR